MSLLEKVQKGKRRRPVLACVYGVPGVGKTTFAASAPGALIWCIEPGADRIDVAKLPAPATWGEVKSGLHDLTTAPHDYRTLAVDTLDALEAIAVEHVCKTGNKPTLADFGWGAGYALLGQEWRVFLKALEVLRDTRDMNIILIAHEHRKAFADPELGSFEMYRPKLNDRVWGLTNETCDAVLFAQFEQGMLEKDGQKARAIVSGRRVLRTVRGTGFFAKNRYDLPETIPLDWKTFESAAQVKGLSELQAELASMIDKLDTETRAKVDAFLEAEGRSEHNLRAAVNRVHQILSAA